MKGYIKAIIIILIILTCYTIFVYSYAENKSKKNKQPDKEPHIVEPDPQQKPDPITKTDYDLNMILYPKTIISYSEGKWYDNDSFDYSDKNFDVYTEETYSSMKLLYTDRWYIMDNDRNFVDYDDFVAVFSNIPYLFVKNIDSELTEQNNNVIKQFLDSENIKYNFDNLRKSVLSYDLNHDGIRDDIYVVSNLFLDDYNGFDSTFAFVFVRTLNQNIVIFRDLFREVNAVSICNPEIQGVLQVDDYPQLIISCSYFSAGGTKHIIYSLDGKIANKLLETKAN